MSRHTWNVLFHSLYYGTRIYRHRAYRGGNGYELEIRQVFIVSREWTESWEIFSTLKSAQDFIRGCMELGPRTDPLYTIPKKEFSHRITQKYGRVIEKSRP